MNSFTKHIIILLCSLLLVLSGCTTYRSHYKKKTTDPYELHWEYKSELQIRKGKQVFTRGNSWRGLPEALSCLPKAKKFAEVARSSTRASKAFLYSSVSLSLVSLSLSLYVVSKLDNQPMSSESQTILFVSVGGLLAGGVLAALGGLEQPKLTSNLFDAFDYYNDHYKSEKACLTSKSSQTPSPSKKPSKQSGKGANQ